MNEGFRRNAGAYSATGVKRLGYLVKISVSIASSRATSAASNIFVMPGNLKRPILNCIFCHLDRVRLTSEDVLQSVLIHYDGDVIFVARQIRQDVCFRRRLFRYKALYGGVVSAILLLLAFEVVVFAQDVEDVESEVGYRRDGADDVIGGGADGRNVVDAGQIYLRLQAGRISSAFAVDFGEVAHAGHVE